MLHIIVDEVTPLTVLEKPRFIPIKKQLRNIDREKSVHKLKLASIQTQLKYA